MGDVSYISEAHFAGGNEIRRLKKQMKKNNRICGIENTPINQKADPSTLLRGIGAVLGEIQ